MERRTLFINSLDDDYIKGYDGFVPNLQIGQTIVLSEDKSKNYAKKYFRIDEIQTEICKTLDVIIQHVMITQIESKA